MTIKALIFTHGPDFPAAEWATRSLERLGVSVVWVIEQGYTAPTPVGQRVIRSQVPRLGNLNGIAWLKEQLRIMEEEATDVDWLLKVDSDGMVLSLDWLAAAGPAINVVGMNHTVRPGTGLFGFCYALRPAVIPALRAAAEARGETEVKAEDLIVGELSEPHGVLRHPFVKKSGVYAGYAWIGKPASSWVKSYQTVVVQRNGTGTKKEQRRRVMEVMRDLYHERWGAPAPVRICIPLHHGGGKLKDDSELRFALRALDANFTDPYEVTIVGKRLPSWLVGVNHVRSGRGLKTALLDAAAAHPEGFFWFYDDCCVLRPTSAAMMRNTPACRNWVKPTTKWARQLQSIHDRLVEEGFKPWDYSRPHGPYWFDKAMVDEAFTDWPGMEGKFPWESWILSLRDCPRSFGAVKQYYGAFKGAPGEGSRYLNHNDGGFTPELRSYLEERFPKPSRFEKVKSVPSLKQRIRGVVIRLPGRPRWENECAKDMASIGIDLDFFDGVDGHAEPAAMPVNESAFRKDFRRKPLPGEIGCYSSHIKLARAFDSLPPLADGFENWRLVFEDDAQPVDIDASHVLRIAELAELEAMDCVMLHTGKNDRRGAGDLRIALTTGKDVYTHACLFSRRAYEEMSGWEMRHPIDHAITKSKVLRVAGLHGPSKFVQRPPSASLQSIHRERRAGKPVSYAASINRPDAHPSRIIHQVWIQGENELPAEYKQNREKWAQAFPDFEMRLWTEESASKQWADYAELSKLCYHHATRADIILARAIRDFGGLAVGTDCTPNDPSRLRSIIEEHDTLAVIVPGRNNLSNGLQWSAHASHPFWCCVCNHQIRRGGAELGSRDVPAATGPKCYMHVFNAHPWELHLVTAAVAYTHDWRKLRQWENPLALVNPGYAASWHNPVTAA